MTEIKFCDVCGCVLYDDEEYVCDDCHEEGY
jgi:hypothetical protein